MSFILDALKKSENDRQRQSGPALFEVRVAPPRSKFPLVAVVIVSLLVVNLGVVGWLMMRKPAAAAVPPAPAAAVPPAATQQALSAQPSPPAPAPTPSQGYVQNAQGMPPPGTAPQAAYNGAQPPPDTGKTAGTNGSGPPAASTPPNTAGASGVAPNPDPSLAEQSPASAQERLNPDDYAPAREAPPPGLGAGRVTRSTESGLPNYEEAATRTSIPPLHMDLHSYAADPTKRFVLINMKRLYEGQSLPEGPKVEHITTDSAIMSYKGTQFVLDKD